MSDWISFFADVAISHLWQGILLVVALFLAMYCYRRNSAASRYFAWLAALIFLMLMPLATMLPSAQPALSPAVVPHWPASPPPLVPVESIPTESTIPAPKKPEVSGLTDEKVLPIMVVGVWAAISILQLWQLLTAQRAVARTRRRAVLAPDALQQLSARLAAKMGRLRPIPVWFSPDVGSPQATGFFRPVILLPKQWAVSTPVLEQVLVHELAHIKRADHRVVWLQFVAKILFGFNPAVGFVIREMNRERETACDDWVMRMGYTPKQYALSLVSVAESLIPEQVPELAISCLRSRTHLRRRIIDMLDHRKNRSTHRRGVAVCIVMLLAIASTVVMASQWPALQTAETLSETQEPQPEDGLLYAVWSGDLAEAARLIDAGVDVNALYLGREPNTALNAMYKPRKKVRGMFELVLGAGAMPGPSEVRQKVIESDTDPRPTDGLLYAAWTGNAAEAKRLIAMGADINEVHADRKPRTALDAAVTEGDFWMSVYLMDLGAISEPREDDYYNLDDRAHDAVERDLEQAQAMAQELLMLAQTRDRDWHYGNAIHHGHLVLGRVALRQGKLELAKEHLLKAGQTPGSPQLNSFGPNMTLAKELLEVGESDVVLKYFELCAVFWEDPFEAGANRDLANWTAQVEGGEIPKFGGNLRY